MLNAKQVSLVNPLRANERAIYEYLRELCSEEMGKTVGLQFMPEDERNEDLYTYLIDVDEEEYAGFVQVRFSKGDKLANLRAMYVSKPLRRQGIGARTIDSLLRGFDVPLSLFIRRELKPANKFAEALPFSGFEVEYRDSRYSAEWGRTVVIGKV